MRSPVGLTSEPAGKPHVPGRGIRHQGAIDGDDFSRGSDASEPWRWRSARVWAVLVMGRLETDVIVGGE
jgi:hypothetical protein